MITFSGWQTLSDEERNILFMAVHTFDYKEYLCLKYDSCMKGCGECPLDKIDSGEKDCYGEKINICNAVHMYMITKDSVQSMIENEIKKIKEVV